LLAANISKRAAGANHPILRLFLPIALEMRRRGCPSLCSPSDNSGEVCMPAGRRSSSP